VRASFPLVCSNLTKHDGTRENNGISRSLVGYNNLSRLRSPSFYKLKPIDNFRTPYISRISFSGNLDNIGTYQNCRIIRRKYKLSGKVAVRLNAP
jgi:hypothetical protein